MRTRPTSTITEQESQRSVVSLPLRGSALSVQESALSLIERMRGWDYFNPEERGLLNRRVEQVRRLGGNPDLIARLMRLILIECIQPNFSAVNRFEREMKNLLADLLPYGVAVDLYIQQGAERKIADQVTFLIEELQNLPHVEEQERRELEEWLKMFLEHQGSEAADDLCYLLNQWIYSNENMPVDFDRDFLPILVEILQQLPGQPDAVAYMEQYTSLSNTVMQVNQIVDGYTDTSMAVEREILAVGESLEAMQIDTFGAQRENLYETHLFLTEAGEIVQRRIEDVNGRIDQGSEMFLAHAGAAQTLSSRQEIYQLSAEEITQLLDRL